MEETERAKIGRGLDHLRDVLQPYVDAAMTAVYGETWTEVVAADDAKRRPNGRKWVVKKSDLSVLLKTLIHRRIDPWQTLEEHPRVTGYASELLSIRNIHAHGGECVGEYERFVDTAFRLVTALGLLAPISLTPEKSSDGRSALPILTPSIRPGEIAWELRLAERLGEPGGQLLELLNQIKDFRRRWAEEMTLLGVTLGQSPEETRERLLGTNRGIKTLLDDLASILDGLRRNGDDASRAQGGDLRTLALRAQLEFDADWPHGPESGVDFRALAPALLVAITAGREDEAKTLSELERLTNLEVLALQEGDLEALAQIEVEQASFGAEVARQSGVPGVASFFELIMLVTNRDARIAEFLRAAARLPEADGLSSEALAWGHMELSFCAVTVAIAKGTDPSLAMLPHLREAIAQQRYLAALAPGGPAEAVLVQMLRAEGQLCNDVGLADDAIRALARADEIVDRYPTTDPDYVLVIGEDRS